MHAHKHIKYTDYQTLDCSLYFLTDEYHLVKVDIDDEPCIFSKVIYQVRVNVKWALKVMVVLIHNYDKYFDGCLNDKNYCCHNVLSEEWQV